MVASCVGNSASFTTASHEPINAVACYRNRQPGACDRARRTVYLVAVAIALPNSAIGYTAGIGQCR
jgi:hypothetical protein